MAATEDLDDFDAEMARLRADREEAESALRSAFERSPAILVTEGDLDELWILSPETHPEEGELRVTYLMPDGPRGHFSGNTLDELVTELARTWARYEPVDEAFVLRWTTTPEWTKGIWQVAYVQAWNALQITGGMEAFEWVNERIAEAQRASDYEEATRILVQARPDLTAGRAPNERRDLKHRLVNAF